MRVQIAHPDQTFTQWVTLREYEIRWQVAGWYLVDDDTPPAAVSAKVPVGSPPGLPPRQVPLPDDTSHT